MHIFSNSDKERVTKEASNALDDLLEKYKGRSILVLLSGGSAFSLLSDISQSNLGSHITISVFDERYSEDPTIGNFSQLAKTEFFNRAIQKSCHFIDTRIQRGEELEQLAERFERELREWRKSNPQRVVIVTQGIGEDGHTAGIMPYPENTELFRRLFEDETKWVVGYDAGEKNPYPLRATITLPFLRGQVDHSVVFALGESKKEALKKVLASNGNLWETPGRIIHKMKDVRLFTDVIL